MRTLLASLVLCLMMIVVSSCSDPMEHAHCEDTEMKRVKSPNGKLAAVVYNRVCGGGSRFSYADIQDPSEWILWPRDRHPTVCYLVTLPDRFHPIDVVWIDDKHLKVSSPDELNRDAGGFQTPEATCKPVEVTYDFRLAPKRASESPFQY